jgi:predicted nucleic acid-binding protein
LILDTCFVSELWRPRPDPGVLRWFDEADEAGLRLSAFTLGELMQGARQVADAKRRAAYEQRIDSFRATWASRILAFDDVVAHRWGVLRGEHGRAGRVVPVVDAAIAATALVHGLAVVTRNARQFEGLVDVVNPWSA